MITLTPNSGISKTINKNATTIEIRTNEKDHSLPFHFKFLNLRENIGISETINPQKTMTRITIPTGTNIEKDGANRWMDGISDAQNKAEAGTGKPKKDVDCRVSTLNFAKRSAEKTGKRKAIKGQLLSDAYVDKYE